MSDESDETERREAEALAHALERGSATDGLPEDALQTAALLRHSAGASELRADREESILAEVLEVAERVARREVAAEPRAASPLWRWLFGLAGGTALAALLLFFVFQGGAPGELVPTELPTPERALLSSGLERLAPGAEGESAAFDTSFGRYRESVYGAMTQRYR